MPIFYGYGLTELLATSIKNASEENKATVYGYYVSDPERYGVAEFDTHGNATSIEEKPEQPKSNYAVVGLYFYPNDVVKKAKGVKPGHRGELEITTLNQDHLEEARLKVELMGRDLHVWTQARANHCLKQVSLYKPLKTDKG